MEDQRQESSSIDTNLTRQPEENLIETHHQRMGPILGIMLLMLALILGGLYLWGAQLAKTDRIMDKVDELERVPFQNNEPETPRAAADAQILETVSPSDELTAIEADLESTSLSSLTDGLTEAESELNAALEVQ
jgi:hypothetical protein